MKVKVSWKSNCTYSIEVDADSIQEAEDMIVLGNFGDDDLKTLEEFDGNLISEVVS